MAKPDWSCEMDWVEPKSAAGLLRKRNSLLLARTLKGALLGLGVGIISILQVSANRRLIVVELDRCIDDALNSV